MTKRRKWSDEEKQTICAQTLLAGVSVSQVARRYSVNANQVFNWLKDPRFSARDAVDAGDCFLPVEIFASSRHEDGQPVAAAGKIEVALAGGHRLSISGAYDPEAVARLIRSLIG